MSEIQIEVGARVVAVRVYGVPPWTRGIIVRKFGSVSIDVMWEAGTRRVRNHSSFDFTNGGIVVERCQCCCHCRRSQGEASSHS